MENDQSITIPITIVLAVLIFVAGWVITTLRGATKAKKDVIDKMEIRLDAIEKQLAQIEFKVTPLWAKVQKTLSDDLHHPHVRDEEMDGLLEKLEGLTINTEETARLKVLLQLRITNYSPEITESERASASIMGIVMDKVLAEAENPEDLTNVEFVGEQKGEKEAE